MASESTVPPGATAGVPGNWKEMETELDFVITEAALCRNGWQPAAQDHPRASLSLR